MGKDYEVRRDLTSYQNHNEKSLSFKFTEEDWRIIKSVKNLSIKKIDQLRRELHNTLTCLSQPNQCHREKLTQLTSKIVSLQKANQLYRKLIGVYKHTHGSLEYIDVVKTKAHFLNRSMRKKIKS